MSPEVGAHHPFLDLQLLGRFHLTVAGVSLPGLEKTRWQALTVRPLPDEIDPP